MLSTDDYALALLDRAQRVKPRWLATARWSGSGKRQKSVMGAAHALTLAVTLVTNDDHFSHVAGLQLEDWL